LDLGKYVGKKPGFYAVFLGRGEAFRRINYGKKLEIYDRNASPSFVYHVFGLIDFGRKETGFLCQFWTSANIWGRNPVSGAGFLGFLGRGEAFRRINYGKKLEIYDRNASPSFVYHVSGLIDFGR